MDEFYALAEPNRRKIIEILAENGQLSSTEICSNFGITAQAVSQHLGILLSAGIVHMHKKAQRHIYELNPDSLSGLGEWARKTEKRWNERLDRLDIVLKEEKANAKKTM